MSETVGQTRAETSKRRSLDEDCQYLKGVGPTKGARLKSLGIENVNDLLTHFPRKYYDRRRMTAIGRLEEGIEETALGQILTSSRRQPRSRRAMVTATLGDDTGTVEVVWFNQPYLLQHLRAGATVIVSGTLRLFRGRRQMVNPEFELVGDDLDREFLSGGRIVPAYRLTRGITQRIMRSVIASTLDAFSGSIPENIPALALEGLDLPGREAAIRSIHFPEDDTDHERARERIKLEELFYMQLVLSLQRRLRFDRARQLVFDIPFAMERKFLDGFPFQLTNAQERVIGEIHDDVKGGAGMNRLLQGDVGSGKTIVAGAALLSAVEAGYQAAMMVPTEILAMQHLRTLGGHFERLGVRAALLVGSMKAAEKNEIHRGLADGSIQIVIGTHAIIQSNVRFRDLAMVIIDEQHRFGVRQRAALMRERESPHVLVMTATPIPRTLALTAYADLDLSVLDEMPATRAPVHTRIVPPARRDDMYAYVRERALAGEQAYLLYPVIEETEKMDLEAAESAYEEFVRGQFRGVGVGLLHGRMNLADKDRVMRAFASGQFRILVTTTVIEVGVHVPAATIMTVHHPERFGLSQLHQLRGRVGRGGRDGYCFLVVGDYVAAETLERLNVLTRERDGFRIAEEDLRLRGPGEFLGLRQHGVPGFKLANPMRDHALVERASACVRDLLEADPGLKSPEGRMCRDHIHAIVSAETGLKTVV